MDSIPDLSPVNNGQLQPYSVNGTHPPYSDMIVAAIVALKDRDGSSRQAIAKYIERNYANLPPTHSNLLTHHLKRMKNLGLLMMVKHSYMLPPLRSVPFESETPSSTPTPTPKPSIDHNIADYPVTSTDTYATTTGSKPENSSARRKPGRPPKPRHEFGFQVQGQQPDKQPAHEFYQPHFDHNSGTGQDFQPQNPLGGSGDDLQSPYGSRQEFQAEPIFASLGLADDGVAPPLPTPSAKRGRGRPPKSSSASRPVVTSSEDGGGEVEPEKSEPRLNRGKSKLMSIMLFNGGGVKRGVGRPRRIGRPVTVPLSGNVMRKRGRPRRPSGYYAENVSDDGGGEGEGEGGSVSVSRGRGRPPKSSGGANKGPVLNSQIGWPNEGATGTSVLVTDPQQLVAFQELKSKYEHLQSRTREVMDVVRPYINSDYAAFGVLQELETLLETDANPHESQLLKN